MDDTIVFGFSPTRVATEAIVLFTTLVCWERRVLEER